MSRKLQVLIVACTSFGNAMTAYSMQVHDDAMVRRYKVQMGNMNHDIRLFALANMPEQRQPLQEIQSNYSTWRFQ